MLTPALICCTHCKSKTVPEAALCPEALPPARWGLSCAKSINVINIARDLVCGLEPREPGLRPAGPGHVLPRRRSSGALQRGQGEPRASFLRPSAVKMRFQINTGKNKSSAQRRGENKSSRSAAAPAPVPADHAGKGLVPAWGPVPAPQLPRRPGQQARPTATSRSKAPSGGRASMGLRTIQSAIPILQMGTLRPRRQEALPLPDSKHFTLHRAAPASIPSAGQASGVAGEAGHQEHAGSPTLPFVPSVPLSHSH